MSRQAISRIWLALMLLVAGLATPALAQTHIRATLLAESVRPAPGGSVTIALRMQPEPGWHGYWLNPGDAGQAAHFDWSLAPGAIMSAPRYPVPERLVIAGLMNHVFNGEHALLFRLTLPELKAGAAIPVRLKAQWLACTEEICVPEQGELTLDLVAGNGAIAAPARAQFDGWRAKLPRPLGSDAAFAVQGKTLRIAIPFPQGVAVSEPWFYAETENAIAYAAPQIVRRKGDMLIVETALSGDAPARIAGVLAIGKDRGLSVSATPGAVASGGSLVAGDGADWHWSTVLLALGGAILGGLILNVMPCVFPIISLKALSLVRAGGDERAARREALAYAAGVILTCLALGGLLLGLRAGGVAVGWAFQLQNPWILLLLLALAVAITLNLWGVFEMRGFGGGESLAGKGGTSGAFWTGALAAFVATPCTGPFMAAALGAALVLPTAAALAIFGGLGLGLALPFLALGYIPALRRRMPKPGPWMVTFRKAMAVPMALTALALVWLIWRQEPVQRALGIEVAATSGVAFSEARLAALRTDGKPVFLYFTADWCLTCKVNEKAAIERAEVNAAFAKAGVVVMVGDWTNGNPAITRFLESQGRSGVPLYLWYPARGEPQVLPQVLTPGILAGLAR